MKTRTLIVSLCALALAFVGCNSSSSSGGGEQFTQVERLARPAINEGLVTTNAFLIAFNGIAPSEDLGAGAAPVRAEVVQTLEAVDDLDGVQNVDSNAIAGAFLPDVMRVDTSRSIPTSSSAYDFAFNALGSPITGRKLEDDVIDITLTVLVGAPVSDGVSYDGPALGGNPAQPGHQRLRGQASAGGPATFPFLATPN